MKVVGRSGNKALVAIDENEMRTITGESYNSTLVKNIFHENATPEINLIDIYNKMSQVKGIPADLKNLQKQAEQFLTAVNAAVEGSKALPVLHEKRTSTLA